jgi:Holliday junction resolvase
MRRKAKVDANQNEIVQALRQAHCQVLSLATLGSGVPDVLVCRHLQFHLLEIKMPKSRNRLSDEQKEFHSIWPVKIVTSVDEALAAVGAVKGGR